MTDPTAHDPFRYQAVSEILEHQAAAEHQPAPIASNEQPQQAVTVVAAPLNGEVLPPETTPAPAPETPPTIPQYPIGLIDFNLPIAVIPVDEYDETEFDRPLIVAVLKGSLHPIVVSFWKTGEQCIDQFDTDGDSLSGDHKVEQDSPYPRTMFVVVGRDGRKLVLDEDLYASEEAAREETGLSDVAGIFPLVIHARPAPEPVVEASTPAPQLDEAFSDQHDGDIESEEQEDEVEEPAPTPPEAPTEMYVAGQMRRVGQTVHASRQGFGVRVCTIVKLRRDARKSLYIDPKDGNGPYWAMNKNIRHG
jgi:hypothetical protein